MRAPVTLLSILLLALSIRGAEPFQDRFVWIFGWGPNSDADVQQITRVLDQSAGSGFNGAVFSAGLDLLCRKTADDWRRLEALQSAGQRDHLEFIPSVFSVGYGGGTLAFGMGSRERFGWTTGRSKRSGR